MVLTFVLFTAYCGRLQPIGSVWAIVRNCVSAKCDKSVEWRPAVMTMTQHNIYSPSTQHSHYLLQYLSQSQVHMIVLDLELSHNITLNLYQKTIFILTRNHLYLQAVAKIFTLVPGLFTAPMD